MVCWPMCRFSRDPLKGPKQGCSHINTTCSLFVDPGSFTYNHTIDLKQKVDALGVAVAVWKEYHGVLAHVPILA